MSSTDTRHFEVLTWKDIQTKVRKVNRKFSDIIDQIDPDDQHKLVKVRYSFGDLIVNQGSLQIPHLDKILHPAQSPHFDKKVKKLLSYSPIPLALLLDKGVEVFVTAKERISPLISFHPGEFFGTYEVMDFITNRASHPIWNVSAGARTVFTLAKISQEAGVKRLRMQYNFPGDLDYRHISDHWHIFKAMSNSQNFNQNWNLELIFFSEAWFKHTHDVAWSKFNHYVMTQTWQQSNYAIDRVSFALGWTAFIEAVTRRKLHPSPYLTDTIKHLFLLAAGSVPGIAPVTNSILAPVEGIQTALIDTYQLDKYAPTIMTSAHLSTIQEMPIYYSLSYPNLLEGFPLQKDSKTLMLALRDLKLLIDTLFRTTFKEGIYHKIINRVNFSYFHLTKDPFKEIKSSADIVKDDARFVHDLQKNSQRVFCNTSTFWRGCIRLMPVSK